MIDEQLRADVAAIARPDGRMVGSPGHARARAYLERRLAAVGLVPYRGDGLALPYHNARARLESYNLVGAIPGADRQLPPVLIGAHYDSVIAAPSADDNAAAVAIALSAVGVLRATPRERDVVIALFDAEEPPYFLGPAMGSIPAGVGQDGLIRDYVVSLAAALADADLAAPAVDTTAMEIRYLEAALGPVLPAVLTMLRIGALETRADLARLALGLQMLGV